MMSLGPDGVDQPTGDLDVQSVEELLAVGVAAFAAHDDARASAVFALLSVAAPLCAAGHHYAGMLALRAGRFEDAVQALSRAQSLVAITSAPGAPPTEVDITLQLALAALSAGDAARASAEVARLSAHGAALDPVAAHTVAHLEEALARLHTLDPTEAQ